MIGVPMRPRSVPNHGSRWSNDAITGASSGASSGLQASPGQNTVTSPRWRET